MIFAGPGLGLGHPARPVVTWGLGTALLVPDEVTEAPAVTYPDRELLDKIIGDYPYRVQPGTPPLEVVGEMYLTQDAEMLPTAEVEWHPTRSRGKLIDTRGTCGPRLNRRSGPVIGHRDNRLPKRRK